MAASISSENGDLGFQIAPMVDVVFVLLLFFMAAAGSQIATKELSISVPSRAGDSYDLPAPIFIDVDATGRVAVNKQVYAANAQEDLSRLTSWLTQISAEFGSDPVLIRPTPDARHDRIMSVLDACAAAKVTNVSFQ